MRPLESEYPAVRKEERPAAPLRTAFLGTNRRRTVLFAGYTALVLLAFLLPIIDLFQFAAARKYYNHILLVPFISLYLIWEKRSELSGAFKSSFAPAVALFVIGIISVAFLYTGTHPMHLSSHHALVGFSFLSLLFAGALFFFGAETLRKVAFPVLFLILLIPLPQPVMHWVQVQLQLASAEAAYWMLTIMNVPMLRDGVDFKLPGIDIRVAEECSGFNSTFVLFVVSLLGGYLFLNSPWRRGVLAMAVIPLAIIRNGFRITTIAMLCVYKGPEMIHSPIHHRGGPVFFALSLIPFGMLLWWLRRSDLRKRAVNRGEGSK